MFEKCLNLSENILGGKKEGGKDEIVHYRKMIVFNK
jgi:hypothetical protein